MGYDLGLNECGLLLLLDHWVDTLGGGFLGRVRGVVGFRLIMGFRESLGFCLFVVWIWM